MNKILIITPHYPPSNLAAVHRSRLFAQHLPNFGWEPIILCVDDKYYEEELDWELVNLIPKNQHIEKTNAFSITSPRLIGDIGLRALFHLYFKALNIVRNEKIDFIFIPIPSFYVSLVGRCLHSKTKIPYGIDYIDPWVHTFPGSNKFLSRHWFSSQIAKILEPIAIKKASIITGVAQSYFQGVIDRNKNLIKNCLFDSMPYGGEPLDNIGLDLKKFDKYLFKKNNKIQLVYAGAMLPKAFKPLENILKSISENIEQFYDVEFHFIGTGKGINFINGYNIKELAEKYNLWNTIVFEHPTRIPYLDVLYHLNRADAIFILGSTEPHYTPSKVYQAVLSKKPILGVLHCNSSAVSIIEKSNSGYVVSFNGELDVNDSLVEFSNHFNKFRTFILAFKPELIDQSFFTNYTAKSGTEKLTRLLDQVMFNRVIN